MAGDDDKKTVLVTGATGLLGRQVVRAFERRQWRARGTGLSRADGTQVLRVDLGSAAGVGEVLDDVRWVVFCPPLVGEPVEKKKTRRKINNVCLVSSLRLACFLFADLTLAWTRP